MLSTETFRVYDEHGNVITGGVTEETANLLDVMDAILDLKAAPNRYRVRTSDGWIVERE